MVNLPSSSLEAQAVGEHANTHPSRRARSHHSWGARLGRRREEFRGEPATLGQLEERAERSVELMEKYGAVSDRNFDVAMDLLRQQYNMNFVVICEKCKGSHLYDEIMAPESSIKVYEIKVVTPSYVSTAWCVSPTLEECIFIFPYYE